MNWKESLKLIFEQIIFSLVLLIWTSVIVYFFVFASWFNTGSEPFGVPLAIWSDFPSSGISLLSIVVDIFFWYLISCVIILNMKKGKRDPTAIDFLRPSWTKIGFAAAISFIALLIITVTQFSLIFLLTLFWPKLLGSVFFILGNEPSATISVILIILWHYLIACFVFYIYKEIKK